MYFIDLMYDFINLLAVLFICFFYVIPLMLGILSIICEIVENDLEIKLKHVAKILICLVPFLNIVIGVEGTKNPFKLYKMQKK